MKALGNNLNKMKKSKLIKCFNKFQYSKLGHLITIFSILLNLFQNYFYIYFLISVYETQNGLILNFLAITFKVVRNVHIKYFYL